MNNKRRALLALYRLDRRDMVQSTVFRAAKSVAAPLDEQALDLQPGPGAHISIGPLRYDGRRLTRSSQSA